jgi:Ca-activated chloride channel homolog
MTSSVCRVRFDATKFHTAPPAVLLAVTVLVLIFARLAFGMGLEVVAQDGAPPPDGKVVQLFMQTEVAIHDQVAASRHSYQFRNDFSSPVEITCNFALAAGEVVDGFSYWNGTERIVGEVLEKQAATEVYQQLTGVRRDPGILEQEGERFRFRVYPVAPSEVKPVELTTVAPLERREGWVEYVIPAENLPGAGAVLSLSVDIADDLPIEEVETVGFAGAVKSFGPNRKRVVFETDRPLPAGDLAVRYRLAGDDTSLRLVAHRQGDADGSFMLIVSPKSSAAATEVIGRDIVFVVDRSGSMDGEPLAQVKSALSYIVGALHDEDRFDVVAFDDEARSLLGGLQPASPPSRRQAVAGVEALAGGGGTDIRGALGKALDELELARDGRPKAIVFLTDGQGDDPPEIVLQEIERRDTQVRIFGFGAGDGVNRPFLERLARDNRGIAAFVRSAGHVAEEMTRLYERISMPLMTDLSIDWGGLDVTAAYPRRLPDLYRDGEVVVLGRYGRPGRATIRVDGRLKGRKVSISLAADLPASEPRYPYVEKLWAARRVDHLMDLVRARTSSVEGAGQGGADELVQEVTRLGIVYNLVTEYTTFLAVPESLQTSEVKELIRQGKRGYDTRLIDSMQGVKLSQAAIPPGDPVLTVAAPGDARMVIAYFPFGLVKRLAWDAIRGQWSCRFLVPRDVEDGVYSIQIQIVHADGASEWRDVPYLIDATAPEFDAYVPDSSPPGEAVEILVDPFEPVDAVYAYVAGAPAKRVLLELDPGTGSYRGSLALPASFANGKVTVRVVVRDLARNRFERDFDVWEDSRE